jgi:hypothetical protein
VVGELQHPLEELRVVVVVPNVIHPTTTLGTMVMQVVERQALQLLELRVPQIQVVAAVVVGEAHRLLQRAVLVFLLLDI